MKFLSILSVLLLSSLSYADLQSVEQPELIVPAATNPLFHETVIGGKAVKDDGQFQRKTVFLYMPHAQSSCTGVIVTEDLVLTAAHCLVSGDTILRPMIVFGANAVKQLTDPESDLVYRLGVDAVILDTGVNEKFKRYPGIRFQSAIGAHQNRVSTFIRRIGYKRQFLNMADYVGDILPDDLALIKLDKKIPAGYKPAKFYSGKVNFDQRAAIAGYGLSRINGMSGGVLRLSSQRIFGLYKKEGESVKYWGVRKIGQAGQACSGDSGGPLYLIDNNNELKILGIASFVTSATRKCDLGYSWYVNPNYYKEQLRKAAEQLNATSFI